MNGQKTVFALVAVVYNIKSALIRISIAQLFTQLGELTIKGKDLHINEISVESGDVSVEGDIWALVYGEKDRKKKLSAIGKIFR